MQETLTDTRIPARPTPHPPGAVDAGRTTGRESWRFPLAFLLAVLLGGGAVLGLGRLPAAARCLPPPRPDLILVECGGLGDYEHAAYALGLEPAAGAALGRAQVVVLGNSRAQFAFSTPPVRDHFARTGIPFYLAGFGYGEGSAFARDVLARAGARPRAVIVNADPFFSSVRSGPAAALREASAGALIGALRIKVALALRNAACGRPVLDRLCRGRKGAIYRDARDGAWVWQGGYRPGRPGTQVDAAPGEPLPPPDAETVARARDFLAALGTAPSCVFLTAVPNSLVRADDAVAALAAALGTRVVRPAVPGLRTLDTSHLDAGSAEAWSRAFLDAASPEIDACVAAPTGS